MSQVVSRSLAPDAPKDSYFPNNPQADHAPGCLVNQSTYSCSCGLTSHQLDTGCFVLYDPYSMYRANHLPKIQKYQPITDMEGFLAGLRIKSREFDMESFRREEEK